MAGNSRQSRRNNRPSSVKLLQRPDSGLAAFADASVDAFLLFDDNLDLMSINHAGEILFGVSKEMAVGKNIVELEPDIKETGKYDKYLDVMKTGELFFVEEPFSHPKFGDMHLSIKAFKMRKGLGMIVNDITERRQMEKALRESELLAIATIEVMSDGVVLVGMDGKVAYINKAFEKMLGYKLEELVGTSAVELPTYSGSKDRKKARQALKMVIEKGSAEPIDMIALSKDGVEIPINFAASVVKDAKGYPKTLVAVIRDVTERRKAEEALRQSEEYFRALTENASDGVVVWDRDGTVRYESPSMERMLGRKPGEGVGKSLFEFAHPDDAAKIAESLAELVQSPDHTLHTEMRMLHGDGSWRIFEGACKNLLDNPVVEGLVINARDITERRKMEKALQQSELNYRVLFDSTLDGLFVVDSETMKVVLASESGMRIAKMFGFDSLTDLNIADIAELFHPEDRDRVIKTIAEDMFEKDLRQINEFRMLPKDGREMWISAVGTRTIYQGKLAGLVSMRDITERKRMEEELRLLSDAVKMTTDSVAITDMGGRILDINEAGLRMYGLSDRADFVGRNPLDAIAPEDRRKALKNMAKLVETGKVEGIEYHVLRKDGSRILIETSVSVIRGGNGEPKGLVAVARDITESRKAEEALKHSEEYFRALTENMSDAIVVLDADGIIRYEGTSMDSVLGYKAGERAGMNGLDFIHQDDVQNAAEDLATLIQHPGSSIGKELRVKHHDGSWRTAELTATNLLDNPAVGGIVINFRDITERRKAQEALKQSEKRYRQLFESMQEGLWLIDKDSITTFVNPRMAEILGYTAEEMLGKHLFAFMDERGIEVAKYNLERRQRGIKEQHDFEFIRKDGARVYASLETSPITDEAGNYVGALACVADITERKKAEEEKQRMEEQLRLAGRLAAVGELSAGVAHELNNPIAAIQGFAQLLTGRNDLDETMKNDLGIIYREAQRAAKITQNLLSFARRHEPEKHLISLNEVIEKTLELRAHQMKVNNIEVVVEFATDLPKTTADFFQMQQVFVNIINNAEQAMVEAHRKGRLVVKTQKAGNMIQATFADDGPGISEDNLKRIFDPFFTTKEVGKGTGLGLSICYGIVEAHGGRIYARSKLGQGATVVVEIPIVAEGQ